MRVPPAAAPSPNRFPADPDAAAFVAAGRLAVVALVAGFIADTPEFSASAVNSAGSSTVAAVRDVEPVPLVVTRWLPEVPARLGALLRGRELAIQLLPWEVREMRGLVRHRV